MPALKRIFSGASADSFLLAVVKLVTVSLGFCTSRILAEQLSLTDYGTYSQIMLMVSTISTVSIFGMIDGANYFFYHNANIEERESYLATIFSVQAVLALLFASGLMCFSGQIVHYFGNHALKNLLIFAALLPYTTNSVMILQVLFIAIGKAKQIALRNLLLSSSRLLLFWLACRIFRQIWTIFFFTVLMDLVQILYFRAILARNGCRIRFRKTNFRLVKQLLSYCLPMAVFLILNTLMKDCDRYVVSAMTDTDTLAVYATASKPLPFDIIMASFCTVLVPYITRYITQQEFSRAAALYRQFLEISYLTTAILAVSAIAAAPMLLELLYSAKYLRGLSVFVLYILVDLIRFTNITLILSASGQTQSLMRISAVSLGLNLVLNLLFFRWMGIIGPAVATLLVTMLSGILILRRSIGVLNCKARDLFDFRFLALFSAELLVVCFLFSGFSRILFGTGLHYFLRLLIIGGGCGILLLGLNLKRLLSCIKRIGQFR